MSTELTPIQQCYNIISGMEAVFSQVSVDNEIAFEREARFAMQTLTANDFTRGVALQNPQSLKDCITNVAAIGISLNPARKQAYLVPRKGAVCLDVSFVGLMDLAQATGSVVWTQCEIVYEKDTFEIRGMDQPAVHNRNPFAKDRGDIVGVYCTVKLATGDYLTHTMAIDAVYAIRNKSEQWSKNAAKGGAGPWLDHPVEMIRKTCVKQASKYWPRVERLDKAIHHLNTDGGEGLNFNPEQEAVPPAKVELLAKLLRQVQQAQDVPTLDDVWASGVKEINGDRNLHQTLKTACMTRKRELTAPVADIEDVEPKKTGDKPPADDQLMKINDLIQRIKIADENGLHDLVPEMDQAPAEFQDRLNKFFNDRVGELEAKTTGAAA